eukprot:CAMPEP_0173352782 /NCGR_PEP_ID=MMETSP1144-20121109/16213_1 /TAXON_ID=483371 /ORGANISM="non described non described, Strain CCMP2298" /LENGTH=98 /DNA_ID=CAMNT_0014301043 /DNA_START=97 /DNA_END=389 /DNA_ORIENTATION=+
MVRRSTRGAALFCLCLALGLVQSLLPTGRIHRPSSISIGNGVNCIGGIGSRGGGVRVWRASQSFASDSRGRKALGALGVRMGNMGPSPTALSMARRLG